MTTAVCAPLPPWPLSRRGQDNIAWDADGIPIGATVNVQLEGSGPWYPVNISDDRKLLWVLAAGPDFASPDAGALLVTVTSHAEIRIIAGQATFFMDAGYVELVA